MSIGKASLPSVPRVVALALGKEADKGPHLWTLCRVQAGGHSTKR
jgi:hypothetical protein